MTKRVGKPSHNEIVNAIAAALDGLEGPSGGPKRSAGGEKAHEVVRSTYVNTGLPTRPANEPLRLYADPVLVDSKRGARAEGGDMLCAECNTNYRSLWLYTKSNRGKVYICSRCKPKVLDRSHGHVDASRVFVEARALHHDHDDGKREGLLPD